MPGARIAKAMLSAGLGWYLLSPPVYTAGPRQGEIALDASYPEWSQLGAFDSATECEIGASDVRRKARESAVAMKGDDKETRQLRSFMAASAVARCVASDDPRLRRN